MPPTTDDFDFSDSMHMRASLMTDFPGGGLPANMVPSDDHQGMLNHDEEESMRMKERLKQSGVGIELADRIATFTIIEYSTIPEGEEEEEPMKEEEVNKQRRKDLMTPSVAFRKGEQETILKVLEEVDRTAAKRMREGFNEFNFAVGVLNSFFIAFVFGRLPQHLWLVYFVESLMLLPTKFRYMWRAKPLNEALYYLDLCWMLNFSGVFALLAFTLDVVNTKIASPEWIRKEVYLAMMGAACGPLLGATIVLPFVSFLFHDVCTMTGLFIHILPVFVAYTFRWHSDEIQQAWPGVFSLDYLDDVKFFPDDGPFVLPFTGLGTIAGNTIALYFVWFILYVTWMVSIGMDLPRAVRHSLQKNGTPMPARYDTVFHCTVRGGLCITIGSVCWGRPKSKSLKQMETNDFELRDFAVYMAMHAFMACVSVYALAYPCFRSKDVHLGFLAFLTSITVWRGAKRYSFYSTAMYGRLIRKNFHDLIADEDESKKSK